MRWLAGLLLCVAALHAEPAKVKQATGTILRTKGKIQTGSSSRIELELPYLAIVRVGSNADFSFSPDAKTMSLESGTMLLAVPEKVEGISIESGSTITSLVKGDLQMSNVGGQVKVVVLNGKVRTALAANPSDRRTMRAGDMVTVPAGATSMPPVTAIRLSALLKTSILFNMGPLPSSRAIRQNATSQQPPRPFVTGGFDPDFTTGGLLSIGPPGTASMIQRMEANVPAPPVPVIPPGQIPTASQVAALEANNLPVPNVSAADSRRILRGDPGIRERLRDRLRPPPTPPPVATPAPTRPPVVSPPIVIPRPTLRPPIAVP